jgi:hypothetical protein
MCHVVSFVQQTRLGPDINCQTNHPSIHPLCSNPSWKANSSSASQEMSHIWWKLIIRYCVHNFPPLVTTLSHKNSVHALPTYFRFILIVSSHPCLGLPGGLFPSDLPTKALYVCLPSHTHTVCPTHAILCHLIAHTILGEQYTSLSSPLCSFPNSPVTSSLLGPYTFLRTLFSNTFTPFFSLDHAFSNYD